MKTFVALLMMAQLVFSQTGRTDVEKQIAALANNYGGTIGVYAKDLNTGEVISVNADSLFPTASAIKLPILVTLFHKIENGALHRKDVVSLTDSNKWGGSGVLQFFYTPQDLKLINAAVLMIVLSDNTATNLVIDSFANIHDEKLAAVNSLMDSLGLIHTRLLNKMMSWKTKKNTPESLRFGVGYSTPEEMARLVELIAEHKILSPDACDEIIKILSEQQDNEMIPRFLPVDSTAPGKVFIVAHKTGSVDESKIDVGLVVSPESKYVVSIFADRSRFPGEGIDNPTVLAVAHASRLIYDYFASRKPGKN
ncbi:MAG: serine hydrolase [Candidatus Kryptoniota bacterium]